jgi:hypothetical protein
VIRLRKISSQVAATETIFLPASTDHILAGGALTGLPSGKTAGMSAPC